MSNYCPPSKTTTTLVYGALGGLALLAGEFLVGLVSGNQLKASFYYLAVPVHVGFGLALGCLTLILGAAMKKHPRTSKAMGSYDQFCLGFIPVTVAFLQGAIVVNELVLSRSPFYSLTSLSISVFWVFLMASLYLAISYTVRRHPSRLSSFDMIAGLMLSSFCISSLYYVFDRPLTIVFWLAVARTMTAFLIASTALTLPTFASLTSSLVFPGSKTARIITTAVTVMVATGIYIFISYRIPHDTYELRPRTGQPQGSGPNVILIVVDTLRADKLSCYGYHLPTSPNLDEFSATAVQFDRCYSPANWTPPGHASIFTGRYPISHGSHKLRLRKAQKHPTCFPLAQRETTLAEILSQNGYETAAIVANYAFVSKALGLDQGFQFWFATPPKCTTPAVLSVVQRISKSTASRFVSNPVSYRRASDIRKLALKWVSQDRNRPFFLFINFMDPHIPYAPPEPWDLEFGGKIPDFVPNFDALRTGLALFSMLQWTHIRSQYDGEIANVDSELGVLFKALREGQILSQSVIIVTSDHGEYLGEMNLFDHQIGLYEPVTRVPLIIKIPDKTPNSMNPLKIAQTIDILPTILDLLKIPIPANIQGISLLKEHKHSIISQHFADDNIQDWFGGRFGVNQTSIIVGRKQLILSEDGKIEVSNLFSNTKENITSDEKEIETLRMMEESVKEWLTNIEKSDRKEQDLPQFDEAMLENLRSLGYLH